VVFAKLKIEKRRFLTWRNIAIGKRADKEVTFYSAIGNLHMTATTQAKEKRGSNPIIDRARRGGEGLLP